MIISRLKNKIYKNQTKLISKMAGDIKDNIYVVNFMDLDN